jgi:hypothetical protein
MTEAPIEDVDAVVIGATLRGLVAGQVLGEAGLRAVVIERSPAVGGADRSFVTASGARFDHGFHVLDADRSESTTRRFTDAVDGAVHRVVLRRGIVLRGEIMPYAPVPTQMPPALRNLVRDGELVDDIGDELPTRDRLANCYGPGFADLIVDEVLPSFPTEYRHRAFGVDEARLLTNIYPWFFPRARRPRPSTDESRAFHDKLRAGVAQEVIVPRHGGFGGFAEGFATKLRRAGVEVVTSADDLHVEVRPGTQFVEWVGAAGRRFRSPRYFWAEGWAALCRLLDLPCQDVATDLVVVGSFRLDRAAHTGYHEILVGDPSLQINRVHFPAAVRGSPEPLMQVEFAFPRYEAGWATDPDHWRERWLADTRRLGLLDRAHRVDEFDFRSFPMHYNAYGAEGEPLRDADPALLARGSNLYPVVPSMANLNINRYVPRAVEYVKAVVATGGADAPSA